MFQKTAFFNNPSTLLTSNHSQRTRVLAGKLLFQHTNHCRIYPLNITWHVWTHICYLLPTLNQTRSWLGSLSNHEELQIKHIPTSFASNPGLRTSTSIQKKSKSKSSTYISTKPPWEDAGSAAFQLGKAAIRASQWHPLECSFKFWTTTCVGR